jgi:1,2-diacylglycerol 3-beta-glucosyltransferase
MLGARHTIQPLGRAAAAVAGGAVTAGAAIAGVLSAYLGVVTVAATADARRGARRSNHRDDDAGPPSRRRFAVLVPAHNEAGGIEATLSSFRQLDYPPDRFEVHVVADNCSDDTAAVVRRNGWSVHERLDSDHPGKGPALNWLYDRLHDRGVPFDTVVVIDADTTLHRDFLTAMAAALDAGALAGQGFYGVRDPGESTAAALRFAALACRHHLRPLGRTALGGSSGLYGNGMAFDKALIDGRRWSGHLTEDMEFQMDLLLDGVLVVYVPGAVLEAEMPGTLQGATSQNERWELGRIQMAVRYVPKLAGRIRHGDPALRAANIDSLLDHAVPPLSVLVALDGAVTAVAGLCFVLRRRRLDVINLVIGVGSSAVIFAHVIVGLRSVHAPAIVYRALLRAPRMIIWKLGVWLRVLVRPGKVTWTRTSRNAEAT